MDKLVITGCGLLTGFGTNPTATFQRICQGESVVRQIGPHFAPFLARTDFSGSNDCPERSIGMAIAVVSQALSSNPGFILDDMTAVYMSSSKGGMESIENGAFFDWLPDGPARAVASKWKLRAGAFNVVAACASGLFGLAAACRDIRSGRISRAIVGCTEASLTSTVLAGFSKLGVLTRKGMSPFCRERDGFAPGEGAAAFLVQRQKEVFQCGSASFAVPISGYGLSSSFEHPLRFHPEGPEIKQAMMQALYMADLKNDQIDAICLHGTATENNDTAETAAVRSLFGRSTPCFALKPALGHLLGACAAVEMAICLQVLATGTIPLTLGFREADSNGGLFLSEKLLNRPVRRVLSLNFGFGGHVGAVILEKIL